MPVEPGRVDALLGVRGISSTNDKDGVGHSESFSDPESYVVVLVESLATVPTKEEERMRS